MYEKLSPMEKEIVTMISNGISQKEIATKKFHSIETIKTHTKNARYKLGANNAAHMVAIALREGAIQ